MNTKLESPTGNIRRGLASLRRSRLSTVVQCSTTGHIYVRDDPQGSATVDKFQGRVRGTCITNIKAKDTEHFGTTYGNRGPLESLFRQMDFRPLVFGTFGDCNSNVKAVIEMAVEYGVEHMADFRYSGTYFQIWWNRWRRRQRWMQSE